MTLDLTNELSRFISNETVQMIKENNLEVVPSLGEIFIGALTDSKVIGPVLTPERKKTDFSANLKAISNSSNEIQKEERFFKVQLVKTPKKEPDKKSILFQNAVPEYPLTLKEFMFMYIEVLNGSYRSHYFPSFDPDVFSKYTESEMKKYVGEVPFRLTPEILKEYFKFPVEDGLSVKDNTDLIAYIYFRTFTLKNPDGSTYIPSITVDVLKNQLLKDSQLKANAPSKKYFPSNFSGSDFSFDIRVFSRTE